MSINPLSAIEAAGKLFAGYGTLTLGPFTFTGLALPASMPIGGAQQLQRQTLPGGARIIGQLGRNDAAISWSGTFYGQGVSATIRGLDMLRVSGQKVRLAWDVYSYTVIVSNFQCQTRVNGPQQYKISCEVVQDNTAVQGTTATDMALQVTNDLQNANPIAALGAVSQGLVGTSVTDAQTAASATNATTVGSAAYTATQNAVNEAADAITNATAAANNLLAPLGTSILAISQVAPAALDTLGFGTQIQNAAASAGDLANLSAMAAYAGRAQQNLMKASA